ncbi:RES domain-containing protein [Exilibacterium tricleocarpae]|uniref:RES domain-containing protein n=1 Tax=Exilibacterium tricleocarpae TaxID=2591008 RepID=A0A545TVE1_9GAMM|nr:RES family NAD+ phosphorylase [Exilibacterium tricleocarpae]TQV81187.1 RES domain-containing protein [Exilibacterium tricleocarpae]
MSGSYDPVQISRQLKSFHLTSLYRVTHARHRDTPLGVAVAPSRFSDHRGKFAVLYAADNVACAVWESMIRNRFTRVKRRLLALREVRTRLVVRLAATAALPLVDLRGDGLIRIGAPTAVTHDANHAAGRALATAVQNTLPEAAGFLYQSRFTGHNCAAIFDRAIDKLSVLSVTPLITHPALWTALDDYQVVLAEPSH